MNTKAIKFLHPEETAFLKSYTEDLIDNEKVAADKTWKQILESFRSAIQLYTMQDDRHDTKIIADRDRQMAQNLDFIIKHILKGNS